MIGCQEGNCGADEEVRSGREICEGGAGHV